MSIRTTDFHSDQTDRLVESSGNLARRELSKILWSGLAKFSLILGFWSHRYRLVNDGNDQSLLKDVPGARAWSTTLIITFDVCETHVSLIVDPCQDSNGPMIVDVV
jgi:hypothetical protein